MPGRPVPLLHAEREFIRQTREFVHHTGMPVREVAGIVVESEREFRAGGIPFRAVVVLAALYPRMVWGRLEVTRMFRSG